MFPSRLRVGVIGLGRLWETRHRPAFQRLRDHFLVTAVHDQVLRRAEMEAAHQRCAVAGGIRALIERADVDVVYLLAHQWFGLEPVEIACLCKKPVYYGLPVASPELLRIAPIIQNSQIPFMPELARRFYPATLRLRAVLDAHLGKPRLILGQTRSYGYERYGQPGPSIQIEPASLTIDPGSYLIDWCRYLLGPAPLDISGYATAILKPDDPNPDFLAFTLDSHQGAVAQISVNRYHRAVWGEPSRVLPSAGFQIYAERGVAWLEMPDRILWSHVDGVHDERLPMEPTVGEQLNLHFHHLVTGAPHQAPSLDDALEIARLVQQLEQSLQYAPSAPPHAGSPGPA